MLALTLLSLLAVCAPAQATVYPVRGGNRVTALLEPSDGLEEKLELIRNAQHHIHIITYYWDDSEVGLEVAREVRDAVDRGVEVRVLSTLIPTLATDPGLRIKEMLEAPGPDGRQAVVHLVGPVGYPFDLWDNVHEKLLLVDGEAAVVGGRNLSSFIYDARDWEFKVEGPLVADLQQHFKQMLDFAVMGRMEKVCGKRKERCRAELLDDLFGEEEVYFDAWQRYPEGVAARLITHEAPIANWEHDLSSDARETQPDDIVAAVTAAEFQHLRMYNYFLLHTPAMQDFLARSVAAGKTLDIITNSRESSAYLSTLGYRVALPYAAELPAEGISLSLWRPDAPELYLHTKAVIFDDNHAIVGSHNLTTGSTASSSELAIEIWSQPLVSTLAAAFDADKTGHCDLAPAEVMGRQLQGRGPAETLTERVFRPLIEVLY